VRRDREADDAAYVAYVAARQAQLRRIAFAVCGDWDRADDVLQTALTNLYIAWPRLHSDTTPDAYVRRIIVRADIDDRRRAWRRREQAGLDGHDRALPEDTDDTQVEVLVALRALPAMQRKTVLLRYWLGLSVRETARDLNISEGTVKSHTSRGSAALRSLLSTTPPH
jgi:RNA polymerase sigma-70 factor (sigma-E family)